MSIEVRHISKTFGGFRALSDVSIKVPEGELVALLGPSGCGKTTLLRIIAGLESPDPVPGSAIRFYDEDVGGKRANERRVGFVFQHYALFRHMTVFENVAFGLRVRPRRSRPAREAIEAKVLELLQLVQLAGFEHRYPAHLSGGQRQRVALARALAVEPKVLLLDEPFGALDAKVRQELRRWLRRLHDEIHVTSVFVTHDQEEALEVADQVVVMNAGKVEQIGTPQDVYDSPATPFVYDFLGNVNFFHGRVHGGRITVGEADLGVSAHMGAEPASVVAYVRPHDIELSREPGGGAIAARVAHVNAAGPVVRVELLRIDTSASLEVHLAREPYRELDLHVGEVIFATLRNPRVFPQDYDI